MYKGESCSSLFGDKCNVFTGYSFIEITENENDKSKRTFGIVEDEAVIKNTTLLKDAKIGKCAYIKGAFKLKNITVLSSEEEESQIGEGVG